MYFSLLNGQIELTKYVDSGIQFDNNKITRSFNLVLLGGINNSNRYNIKLYMIPPSNTRLKPLIILFVN